MNNFIEIPATKSSTGHRKPIFGLGINDAWYMTQSKNASNGVRICPYYKVWKSMMARSYSSKTQLRQPTYKGCSVAKEWLTFSVFRAWMEKQDWKGLDLDKDILIVGNKEYSPKACIFINRKINKLLNENLARRGDLPQGVSFNREKGKYQSCCSIRGKNRRLGFFASIPDAEIAYLEFKSNLIENIAIGEPDNVKAGLLRHAKVMTDRIKDIQNINHTPLA